VKPLEQNPKTQSVCVGVLVLLGRFIVRGRSSATVRLLGLVFVNSLVLSLCAVPALGAASAHVSHSSPFAAPLKPALAKSNPPFFRSELTEDDIHATRVEIQAEVETEGVPVAWRAEYAENPGGPWIAAGSGTIEGVESPKINIGTFDSAVRETVLHHLTPDTKYYARFVAESTYPAISKTVEFKTLPPGQPEVSRESDGVLQGNNSYYHNPADIIGNEGGEGLTPTTAVFTVPIETNGSETSYSLEYTSTPEAPASWLPFTTGGSGTVSAAADFANIEARLSGLTPETNYYVRIRVKNEYGAEEVRQFENSDVGSQAESEVFKTPTGRPGFRGVTKLTARNVTASTAYVYDLLNTNGLETGWRIEYAASSTASTWITETSGTVTSEQASAEKEIISVSATLKGLQPGIRYFARLSAVNSYGAATPQPIEFTTSGEPTAVTLATHALHDGNLRVLGTVNPNSVPSSDEQTIAIGGAPTGGSFTLTFDGDTTASLPYDAQPGEIRKALESLPSKPEVGVEGPIGGPYTAFFIGKDEGVSEPEMTADGSALTPAGTVTVQTTQEGGIGTDTHYRFEYVSKTQFEAPGTQGGFAKAASTPSVDIGSGDSALFVGQDLPQLTGGETYKYRIVATSNAPGNPVVYGATQSLTAPVAAPVEAQACPNAQSRTGASAELPDCRAYEQVTPVDKEGSQEIFQYGSGLDNLVFVGEDGDHVALEARTINYGSGPDAGGSPYLFSRNPEKGWQMTAGAPQPATGPALVEPALFNADLTQFAFFSQIFTSSNEVVISKEGNNEYKFGPVGGPYVDAASVPRSYPANREVKANWVGASADFSKLFLQSFDHSLTGHATSTKSGRDIYEYSGGHISQVNVGVGSCGAEIVRGEEASATFAISSAHAVSSDGSRVFFEAVPGTECSQPLQLYTRVDASKTIDIGPYRFFAANAQGTRVLLDRRNGEAEEFFLDEPESSTSQPKPLFTVPQKLPGNEAYVSSDLSSIYFVFRGPPLTPEAPIAETTKKGEATSDLYRYDVAGEKLSFVAQTYSPGQTSDSYRTFEVSPEGRYLYFQGAVAGVPSGAAGAEEQVFLYDSREDSIECVSCASSFSSEPKLSSYLGDRGDVAAEVDGRGATENNTPPLTLLSANGDYAFFDTAAALVPQDIDGEQEPSTDGDRPGVEFSSPEFSPSSDVYEWRRDGIDGCAQLQGCLALITSGRGGVLNMLLGSTPTGNDVFVYTKSQLTPSDVDNAGDIYDVRVDGGLPPPPPAPVECEGDACSTPPSAPNDPAQTLLPAASPPTQTSKPPAAKKPSKCAKGKRRVHGKCVKPKPKGRRTAKRARRTGGKRRAK